MTSILPAPEGYRRVRFGGRAEGPARVEGAAAWIGSLPDEEIVAADGVATTRSLRDYRCAGVIAWRLAGTSSPLEGEA